MLLPVNPCLRNPTLPCHDQPSSMLYLFYSFPMSIHINSYREIYWVRLRFKKKEKVRPKEKILFESEELVIYVLLQTRMVRI